MGYASQNLLFDLADSLFGLGLADLDPAQVRAQIIGSDVRSGGDLTLSAVSDAAIDSTIENSVLSITKPGIGTGKQQNISVAATIALNRVATQVRAGIEGAALIQAAGNISIDGQDEATIDALVGVSSMSISLAPLAESAQTISVGLSVARNEILTDMEVAIEDALQVQANGGSVAVLDDFRSLVMSRGGKRTRLKKSQDKGWHAEWLAFTDAIKKGGPPPIPYNQLIVVTRASFAAVESLRSRTLVQV